MNVKPALVAILLASCSPSPGDNAVSEADVSAPASDPTTGAMNGVDNVALPDDRTPLEEPNGPIDPKSTEAAGQVVQSFGALIEQKRWGEAEALWGDSATARAFTAGLKTNRESHLEIGKPGDPDGAAGSIYVTVPVILYGKAADGADFRKAADVTLRRVNDVPGSTEAQRRWHIERIELAR